MARKSKQEKKKRANTRKRLKVEGKPKPVKLTITSGGKSELEMNCPLCGKPSIDGKEHKECMDKEAFLADRPEPEKPFDPSDVVANILKKDGV